MKRLLPPAGLTDDVGPRNRAERREFARNGHRKRVTVGFADGTVLFVYERNMTKPIPYEVRRRNRRRNRVARASRRANR